MSESKKKSVWVKRVLQFLWEEYKAFPKYGIISMIVRTFVIILELLPALYYRDIINLLSNTLATPEIATQGIAILMYILWIKLVTSVLMRVYDYFFITFEMDIQEHLYNKLFSYLQNHSFQFFSDNFTGSLISKIRKCVGSVERLSDTLSRDILPFLLNVIIILIIIGFQNIWISVVLFITVVLFGLIQYYLYKWIYPYQEKANKLDSDLWGLLSDDITNNFNIKIFSSLKREEKDFGKINYDTARARKVQYYRMMWIWGISRLFAIGLEVGTIYTAILLRGQGAIEIGVIVLLQTYVLRIMDYLWGMSHTFRAFFKCVSEIWEVVEIIDTPHSIIDHTNKKLRITEGRIEFNDVNFSYDGKNNVFDQLSLNIKPGERVGLVGPSWGGKTTISKLLFRFYDIQSGTILIDGQDISQVTQDSLRAQIGMVPQDPILFHRSIKENILYGKANATEEEMIAAAKMARCYDFIEKLPNKYDTLVGERGIKLSGGERQRVAIARAILENAPILVMDEATSALDSESEHLIQEAMEELMRNKTVIVIAHRLSTIMKMDKIMVIENWRIIEKGSHNELLLKHGEYAKLRDIQSWGFIGE